MQIQAGIISISDRASQGVYDDLGGPSLKAAADGSYGWKVLAGRSSRMRSERFNRQFASRWHAAAR